MKIYIVGVNLCGPECKAITCSDSKESISSSGLSSRMKTYVEEREGGRRKGDRKGGKGRKKRGRDFKGMKGTNILQKHPVMVVSMETDQIKS